MHVILQQTFRVPFPSSYPSQSVLEQIDQASIVLGLLLLLEGAAPALRPLGLVRRWLALFSVYAMLRESVRGAVMEGVVTTSYAYPLLASIPKVAGYLVIALLCVVAAPALPRLLQKILGALGIYAIFVLLARPLIDTSSQGLLAQFAYLKHDEVYTMPYGANVLVPAYITYIEPTVACIACAALVWQNLGGAKIAVYVRFIFLILLLRRSLFPPFIYALYEPHHRLTSFVSAGQFSLETITLALFAALTWRFASTGDKSASVCTEDDASI